MNIASSLFEKGALFGKIFFVIALLFLSYMNTNTSFIEKEPKKFINECVILGAGAALTFAVVGISRGMSVMNILSICFSAFLIFFIFNVLAEISGANDFSPTTTESSSKLTTTFQKYKKVIGICVSVYLGLMFVLALVVHDLPGIAAKSSVSGPQLAIEAFLFGLINALAIVYALKNRGASDTTIATTTITMFVIFALTHVALQSGGFYTHLLAVESDADGDVLMDEHVPGEGTPLGEYDVENPSQIAGTGDEEVEKALEEAKQLLSNANPSSPSDTTRTD